MLYAFGVFMPAMQRSLGWSKLTLSGAMSLALIVSGFVGLKLGRMLDSKNPKLLMTGGSIVGVVGMLLWSVATTPLTYYFAWAVIGVAMGSTFYEPAFAVVTKWFNPEQCRRALTVITMTAGLASTIFLPLEQWLIDQYGWRGALRVLALILGGFTIPLHALFVGPPPTSSHEVVAPPTAAVAPTGTTAVQPAASTADMSTSEAVRDPRFHAMFASGVLVGLTFSALIAHQVSFLQERGWNASRAAAATGAIGLWQVGGRFVFTPVRRWCSSTQVTVAVYGFQAVALLILALSASPPMVAAYILFTGVSRGMSTLVRATLVAEIFGSANYGAISARLALGGTFAQAVGPLLGGALRSGPGGYITMLWVLLTFAVLATVFAARIHRSPGHLAPPLQGV